MTIFWLLFLYLLFVNIGVDSFKHISIQGKRKLKTTLCGLGVWSVLALRSPWCGTDVAHSYAPDFYRIAQNTWNVQTLINQQFSFSEKGFIIYNKIISIISSDIQFYIFLTALLCIGPISIIIYKYSKSITVSFVIFICFGIYIFMFSGLRQSLAMSICFYASQYILSKNIWKFLTLIAIAFSLHNSALIFLIALVASKVKLNNLFAILSLSIYIGIIVPSLRYILPIITYLLFPGKYQNYQDEGGAITMFIVYLILFIASIIIKLPETKEYNLYRWMIYFAVIFQSLGEISTGAITRIGYYFSIYFCLYIPYFFQIFRKNERINVKILVSALMIVFFYLTTYNGYLDVVPYDFFWDRVYKV